MKLYVSNRLHYRDIKGFWEFWCYDHWEYSADANDEYAQLHTRWKSGLKLVGNNFKLK